MDEDNFHPNIVLLSNKGGNSTLQCDVFQLTWREVDKHICAKNIIDTANKNSVG
jgi:hypothetical protein